MQTPHTSVETQRDSYCEATVLTTEPPHHQKPIICPGSRDADDADDIEGMNDLIDFKFIHKKNCWCWIYAAKTELICLSAKQHHMKLKTKSLWRSLSSASSPLRPLLKSDKLQCGAAHIGVVSENRLYNCCGYSSCSFFSMFPERRQPRRKAAFVWTEVTNLRSQQTRGFLCPCGSVAAALFGRWLPWGCS